MLQIGKKFKLKRKSLGLTQSEYSKLLGIAQGYLSEIENGVKIPSYTLTLLLEHIDKSRKGEKYQQKYLELAEEHMLALKDIFSLKQELLSLNDSYKELDNNSKKTRAR